MVDEFSATHIDQEDDKNDEQMNQNIHSYPKKKNMI
jgi:hypothetical protein